jgi:hypothetical protein
MDPTQIQNQAELNEYIRKTISLTDLAAGGRLNREQAKAFIDQGVDQTKTLNPGSGIRKISANALRGEIDAFDICDYTVRLNTEHTNNTAVYCDTDAREPTFGKTEYDLVKLTQDWKISYEAVKDNIEREGIRTKMNTAMGRKWGNEVEELFWQGDTATYSALSTNQAKLLKAVDGILYQAENCTSGICDATANTVSAAGSTITLALFKRLLRALPFRYHSMVNQLTLYMHPAVAEDYRYVMSTRGTDLGDRHYDGPVAGITPLGIKVMEVPLMPVDTSGNGNYILLTFPNNLWYAVLEEVRRYTRFDQHCDAYFYTNHYFFDCGILNCEAMALLTNLALRSD